MVSIGASGPRKSVILCVEDDPHLRADIAQELRAAGHETVEARDGHDALDKLGPAPPDLVLCDITMPGMDGYGLLGAMRAAQSALSDIPFIFLTARDTREDILAGKRAAVDDYLVKPIDFDLMLASVDARIARARQLTDLKASGPGAAQDDGTIGATLATQVVDKLGFGVILTDPEGNVLFANVRAHALSAQTRGVFLRNRIHLGTAALTAQLREKIANAARDGALSDANVCGMTVPCDAGPGETLSLICMAIEPETTRSRVAIFLSDPTHQVYYRPDLLSSLFGFTQSEAQVVQAIVRGRQRAGVADELGISQTTVAFHLRNIFEKTGTSRQADLVARVIRAVAAIG